MKTPAVGVNVATCNAGTLRGGEIRLSEFQCDPTCQAQSVTDWLSVCLWSLQTLVRCVNVRLNSYSRCRSVLERGLAEILYRPLDLHACHALMVVASTIPNRTSDRWSTRLATTPRRRVPWQSPVISPARVFASINRNYFQKELFFCKHKVIIVYLLAFGWRKMTLTNETRAGNPAGFVATDSSADVRRISDLWQTAGYATTERLLWNRLRPFAKSLIRLHAASPWVWLTICSLYCLWTTGIRLKTVQVEIVWVWFESSSSRRPSEQNS